MYLEEELPPDMRDDDEEVINNIDDKQLQVPLAPCPASNTYTLQVREASFPAASS